MASIIQLPYFASSDTLPHPLPTIADIESSQDILSGYGSYKVVRVGDHFVVKYGANVNLIEGENMLFINQATNIRVPKVYAIFSDEAKRNYIVMENIQGNTLASEWPALSVTQKGHVCKELKGICDQLRNLSSAGYFGSLGRRQLLDGIFWTGKKGPSISGPFETEDALNEAMAQKYIYNNLPAHKAEFYRRSLPSLFRNHRPVFTHADFQRKNIMVSKITTTNSSGKSAIAKEEEYAVTLIDWEMSGWYPSYWEYSAAMYAVRWDDDWGEWVEKILDPYLSEYAWMKMLRSELWS